MWSISISGPLPFFFIIYNRKERKKNNIMTLTCDVHSPSFAHVHVDVGNKGGLVPTFIDAP